MLFKEKITKIILKSRKDFNIIKFKDKILYTLLITSFFHTNNIFLIESKSDEFKNRDYMEKMVLTEKEFKEYQEQKNLNEKTIEILKKEIPFFKEENFKKENININTTKENIDVLLTKEKILYLKKINYLKKYLNFNIYKIEKNRSLLKIDDIYVIKKDITKYDKNLLNLENILKENNTEKTEKQINILNDKNAEIEVLFKEIRKIDKDISLKILLNLEKQLENTPK